jgi:hypothetical protein
MRTYFAFAAVLACAAVASAAESALPVAPQPFQAAVTRLDAALEYVGSPLPPQVRQEIHRLISAPPSPENAAALQAVIDPLCFAHVNINPEARVKVERGAGAATLQQGGWRSFLVKVHNEGAVRGELHCESPNAQPALHRSSGAPNPRKENLISDGELAQRFLEIAFYHGRPMEKPLSGIAVEYRVLQLYTNAAAAHEASLQFHIGEGTRDLGHRSTLPVLFEVQRSGQLVFEVLDHDGSPTMASFTIRDSIERVADIANGWQRPDDYRHAKALQEHWARPGIPAHPPLTGVYPLPARRIADRDPYPDFFFQPQVYRQTGESITLPPGKYDVTWTRGPEYLAQSRTITMPEGVAEVKASFKLERWIHLAKEGWYSADHHVHAGGCSHYESPEAGVKPEAMLRQSQGENLDVACVLTWGPCWYHQKQFFEGKVNALSTKETLVRYDVEVSGFPSSHAGHVCLLRLSEDDYPGTTKIDEWPSWTLPVMQWAKSQKGVTGYAHSGWGLEPIEPTDELPNQVMPKMDGIGANEYIVTVTHDAVDFISAGDTPLSWELNIWYHTLNCGYRTAISGESDYPCIFDERVGMIRTYAPLSDGLNFDAFAEKIKVGESYVSDGRSHILDYKAGDAALASATRETKLTAPGTVRVTARVAAHLPEQQDDAGRMIREGGNTGRPYWHVEKARIGDSRKVPVELVVNGLPVATQEIDANGAWQEVAFDHAFDRSSWVALRVKYSSHTNPLWVSIDGQPVRASQASAQWCRAAVDKCWEMKSPAITREELGAARAGYAHARAAYDRILAEALPDPAPKVPEGSGSTFAAPEGAEVISADGARALASGGWETVRPAPNAFKGVLLRCKPGEGDERFRWLLEGISPGNYEVYAWLPAEPEENRSTNAKYRLYDGKDVQDIFINQTDNTGAWKSLGVHKLRVGSYLELTNEENGLVVADAVALVRR